MRKYSETLCRMQTTANRLLKSGKRNALPPEPVRFARPANLRLTIALRRPSPKGMACGPMPVHRLCARHVKIQSLFTAFDDLSIWLSSPSFVFTPLNNVSIFQRYPYNPTISCGDRSNRVGGCPLVEQPASHTTVRTVRYTAVP
jgi:hypothetical protein